MTRPSSKSWDKRKAEIQSQTPAPHKIETFTLKQSDSLPSLELLTSFPATVSFTCQLDHAQILVKHYSACVCEGFLGGINI